MHGAARSRRLTVSRLNHSRWHIPTCGAVFADNWLDRLNVTMREREADRRVDLFGLVNAALPIGHPVTGITFSFRSCENTSSIESFTDAAPNVLRMSGSTHLTFNRNGGRNRSLVQHCGIAARDKAVAWSFGGDGTSLTRRVFGIAEKSVRRRDVDFNFGTRLRSHQRDRIDRHRQFREERLDTRSSAKTTPVVIQVRRISPCLDARSRWLVRKVIERTGGLEGHVDRSLSFRHVCRTRGGGFMLMRQPPRSAAC